MKSRQLSVFIDESGDFGPYESHCPFYIIAMVLHDQSNTITNELEKFEYRLTKLGFPDHTVHTAPLIRMDEKIYENTDLHVRQAIFSSIFTLARKLPIHYLTATIQKDITDDEVTLSSKITKAIVSTIRSNFDYFSSFDQITVYYDKGQVQLTKIIVTVFTTLFANVEMRKVFPADYRLFQVADLFCTLELVEAKRTRSNLSNSEHTFFGSGKQFKHDYYSKFIELKLK